MNVRKYIKRHEDYVNQVLAGKAEEGTIIKLKEFHARQIGFLQHERLVHLIVTLSTAVLFLLAMIFTLLSGSVGPLVLAVGLLGLTLCYLIHYVRLENSVQRWYSLHNRIEKLLGSVPGNYPNT